MRVSKWAEVNGWKQWRIGGCCSEDYAQAAALPAHEPVAWIAERNGYPALLVFRPEHPDYVNVRPLYTAPPGQTARIELLEGLLRRWCPDDLEKGCNQCGGYTDECFAPCIVKDTRAALEGK
jgi:hypothetical protein